MILDKWGSSWYYDFLSSKMMHILSLFDSFCSVKWVILSTNISHFVTNNQLVYEMG